jgi:uncharacterized membrane protein
MAMGLVKSGLTVLFFAFVVLCIGSAEGQAQTFSLKVCNTSKVSASVAISNLVAVGDKRFEVQGWWTVASGDCDTLGTFPQGWFYIYAEQTNTGQEVWEGDFPLCVEFPGPFDRVNTAGTTCTADNLKQFTSELVPSTTGTFTYTLR